MMAHISQETLQYIVSRPKHARVEIVGTPDGGSVVVKGQRDQRSRASYKLLDGIARMAGNDAMRGVPPRNGAQAQAIEARRLRELHAAGIRVPRVLHEGNDCIVMEHVPAPELHSVIRDAKEPAQVLSLWRAGLDTLAQVHRQHQCLSQSFARNMLWYEEQVVCIDFEEDPLEVMSLPEAQARDWLTYLQSSVMLLPTDASPMPVWSSSLKGEAPGVTAVLRQIASRLGWMRHLPSGAKWGRDLASASRAMSFLYAWSQQQPRTA